MKNIIHSVVLLSFFIACSPFQLSGQEKVVEGIVTTFDSIPVINAEIESRKTDRLVKSDSLGMFRITCDPKDRLKVSANGFFRQYVRIKENTKFVLVNLPLLNQPDATELAVGYGHVKDADKLYAVTNVSENDIDFSKYRSIYDVIEEQFVSVLVRNDGELAIRNAQSISDNSAALLIVDGREVDASTFGTLNTAEIASINVLSDASASVYGSRGANGVVIVETKRGE